MTVPRRLALILGLLWPAVVPAQAPATPVALVDAYMAAWNAHDAAKAARFMVDDVEYYDARAYGFFKQLGLAQ